MKTMTKRIASMTLAVMMALVMLAGALPTKAYAAGTGALTITSKNAEFNGKQVKAWQMFSAEVINDGKNASYMLNDAWVPFFKNVIGGDMATLDGDALSQKAVEHVAGLGASDSNNVIDFAKKASNWAKEQQLAATATATAAASGNSYVAEFTGLAFGYYVVSPQAGSTDVTAPIRGTDAILANVVKATQNVDLKSEYPTVDKTVNGDNHADAQVGDTLDFELKSKVPDMTEYDSYIFNFVDKLSKGLTLNQSSVKVYIDNVALLTSDYSVDVQTVETDKTQLKITMTDFKAKHEGDAGKEIKVTYSATLNENAVVGQDDAGNSAKLEYSNDPSNPNLPGESTEDITHGYTFGFDISKTDADTSAALAGAVFQLQKKGDGTPIKLIVENKGDDANPAVVRPAKTDEMGGAVDTVTTPASGKITFKGLDAAEYQLVETEAPDGYNKLKDPFDVTIVANYNQTTGELESWTVNNQAGQGVTLEIKNSKGSLLPETGGMGTIAFTVVGAAVVVGGVVWAVRRKNAQH